MDTKIAFAAALKKIRKARGLTQEDFSDSSSRTYVSTLERGIKSPTLEKIDALANTLQVHPVTLVLLAYLEGNEKTNADLLLEVIENQIRSIE